MAHHRFTIELDVPDDDENADDTEWWADAAAGACSEYGAENVIFLLTDPVVIDGREWTRAEAAQAASDRVREVILDAIRERQPEGWNPDDGVDEWTDAEYAACATAVLDALDLPARFTVTSIDDQPRQDAWLISITDEGDQDRYVFTDPTWAEWLQSFEPRIGGRLPGSSSSPPSSHVRLTLENIPPTLADLIRAMSPDEREERDLLTDASDAVGELTSGSYLDDKRHFISQFCERVDDVAGLRRWNIVGEYHTIAY